MAISRSTARSLRSNISTRPSATDWPPNRCQPPRGGGRAAHRKKFVRGFGPNSAAREDWEHATMFRRPKSASSAMARLNEIAHHGATDSLAQRSPMTKTILIVEDNELNMKLIHDLLDAHGYKTLQTRNGMEALALAREHRPDLVLMDIQLPEVSGLEVTKWLKEDDQLRKIPVVAVTAFAMKGDEERIREGGW